MRGGADGVGASQPQLIPATILRKNFEFIAAIKPHEVPNRPEFYMIGSGITKASLNALTIGATCTHEDFRAPCFTAEEIAQAKTQLKDEQYAFDELTIEEQAGHTAAGGLAVASPPFITTHTFTTNDDFFRRLREIESNGCSITGGETTEKVCTQPDPCTHPTLGPISHWDTSQVTSMKGAFYYYMDFSRGEWGMSQLPERSTEKDNFWRYTKWSDFDSCDISKWDTSKVTSMMQMFTRAYYFDGDISKWDTSEVTTMHSMFTHALMFNRAFLRVLTAFLPNVSPLF